MNEYAAEITVVHDPAVFYSAALVPEKIQDARSHRRAEPLVEVFFRQYAQQTFPTLAVWIEALGDVHGVGNDALLVRETQVLQAGDDVSRRAVLGDEADAELIIVCLPQDVPTTVR